MRIFSHFVVLAAALTLAPGAAAAQRGGTAQRAAAEAAAQPRVLEGLLRCRTVTEDAARLRCFDEASGALQTATERRDVVVVDRQRVRDTRRRLFGITLPRLPIFGDGDQTAEEAEADHLDGVIANAGEDGLGHWRITLQDGSVWQQLDTRPISVWPRPGNPVVINRNALGTYMMRVNRQPGIRVRRQM